MVSERVANRFRLVEQVGEGGMGTVYRAVDESTGNSVALKLLAGRNEIEVERARREARVLARLAHPAIVAYVDDGVTATGQLYLAMEWIPGETLASRLDRTGFTLRESVAIARQVASALDAANREGVLHRDIKPSNILLVDGDRVKLIDFGIARLGDSLASITRTGLAIGTPGYMSPEQARGDREVGRATDVFALACVLYACATGQPAFSGSNVAAVLVKILLSAPVPFGDLVPEAPPALRELVDRMFEKQVAHRIPNCAAVVEALDAIGPIPAGPVRGGQQSALATVTPETGPEAYCLVLAAQGALEDMLDPPDDDQRAAITALAARLGATFEVCANGNIAIRIGGPDHDARAALSNAAACALELRHILEGWSVAISTHEVDAGASLLAATVMSDIFGHARGVAIEPSAVPLLEPDFEIERDGDRITLLGYHAASRTE